MHIQLALDILRNAGLPHHLQQISAGKFARPIIPDTPIDIVLSAMPEPHVYEVVLSAVGELYSSFTMMVS